MAWAVGIIAFIVGLIIGWWLAHRMCADRIRLAASALATARSETDSARTNAQAAQDEAEARRTAV